MNSIIDFSLVNEAKKIPRDAVDKEYMEPDNPVYDFDESNFLHRQIHLVLERKQIRPPSITQILQQYNDKRNRR